MPVVLLYSAAAVWVRMRAFLTQRLNPDPVLYEGRASTLPTSPKTHREGARPLYSAVVAG